MPLRYVGTVDEMTPGRVRALQDRLRRERTRRSRSGVWDAKTSRMDDESGFLIALPAPPASASAPLVPVRWQNAMFGLGGLLLGLLVAAGVWWWNRKNKKKRGER